MTQCDSRGRIGPSARLMSAAVFIGLALAPEFWHRRIAPGRKGRSNRCMATGKFAAIRHRVRRANSAR